MQLEGVVQADAPDVLEENAERAEEEVAACIPLSISERRIPGEGQLDLGHGLRKILHAVLQEAVNELHRRFVVVVRSQVCRERIMVGC